MRHILCSILILFLVMAGGSCRREKQEEYDYDLGPSRALLTTGEQMLSAQAEAPALAPEITRQLERLPEGRQLAGVLREQRLQRELIHEANLLLATERYNDLADLLARAQREDLATTQLLELAGLPQALQALRLYCARRPYERAADLEQNLDFLRPWTRQLQALSPAFQSFYQEQQQQLLAMRQQEAASAEERVLRELDHRLASAKNAPQAADFLAQAATEFPQLPILRLVQRLDDGWHPTQLLHSQLQSSEGLFVRASTRERLSLELAVALTWETLGQAQRQRLAEEWRNSPAPSSLTGTILRAVCLKDTTFFEDGVIAWQNQAKPEELLRDAPAHLAEYLTLLPDGAPSSAWHTSAPDFASTLIRFLEAAQ
ncbi:MAG: hypothetical protein IKS83_03165 [Victivallales bacterium]|nr:hypothetical protein [Victivallales bacterium]